MISTNGSVSLLSEFSGQLAAQTGLYFPEERLSDLERGISSAAQQFGFADAESCLKRLLKEPLTRDQIEVLASHLTVGETYFFRDKTCFGFLEEVVLPELIRSRKETRQIRIWSAGCSSGEEPYSVAILLDRLLPDIDDWTIFILATDLNPSMLARAQAGIYSAWAFRDVPEQVRKDNFSNTWKNIWKINDRIKRRVTFRFHNLVEDSFPSWINGTNSMDLILCRNVLMYFSRQGARKIASQLGKSLTDCGWLILSPVEIPHVEDTGLTPVQFHGQTFFREGCGTQRLPAPLVQVPATGITASLPAQYPLAASRFTGDLISVLPETEGSPFPSAPDTFTDPARLIKEGRYAEAAALIENMSGEDPSKNRDIVLLVRAYADHGDFDRALRWCERGIVSDRLNPTLHYLHAIILGERGDKIAEMDALRRTLYLDPDFILAVIALGSSARKSMREKEAARHFTNARSLLEKLQDDDAVPESGGLTAGRLREILTHAGGASS